MFTGCKNFNLPLGENFIPNTVTSLNGTFAFTDVPNVISL